jgi:hypothetical protein
MNLTARSNFNIFSRMRIRPGTLFMAIMVVALVAFELFNYSTTDYALNDLLGNLKFAGITWSTILTIAFCGIDFAGVARLFTPEQGRDEPKEVWYLMGAWLLAATMNAILTWWGVSMAISNHAVRSTSVVDQATLTRVVPVFVAVMVWVIRVLIIGTLSVAGDRMLNGDRRPYPVARSGRSVAPSMQAPSPSLRSSESLPSLSSPSLAPRPSLSARPSFNRPSLSAAPTASQDGDDNRGSEPTYHSLNPATLNARAAVRPASLAEPSSGNPRRMG